MWLEIVRKFVVFLVVIIVTTMAHMGVMFIMSPAMHLIVSGLALCKCSLLSIGFLAGVTRIGQRFVKSFGSEERHHHQPGHVNSGEDRCDQPDDPQNVVPVCRQATRSKCPVKNFVLREKPGPDRYAADR